MKNILRTLSFFQKEVVFYFQVALKMEKRANIENKINENALTAHDLFFFMLQNFAWDKYANES